MCSHLVTLRWLDETRHERAETVVLENISASGACVQAEVSVPVGTRVRIISGQHEFRGSARFCYFSDGGHFIGILFDADSKWSKSKFKPEHLLDPRRVKPRRAVQNPLVMRARLFA